MTIQAYDSSHMLTIGLYWSTSRAQLTTLNAARRALIKTFRKVTWPGKEELKKGEGRRNKRKEEQRRMKEEKGRGKKRKEERRKTKEKQRKAR
jgi:hypothetical protein